MKKAAAKPKDKVRKASPISDEDEDDESPKKIGRKAVASVSLSCAIRESTLIKADIKEAGSNCAGGLGVRG